MSKLAKGKVKVSISKVIDMPAKSVGSGLSMRSAGNARLVPLSELDRKPETPARSAGHFVGKRESDACLMY